MDTPPAAAPRADAPDPAPRLGTSVGPIGFVPTGGKLGTPGFGNPGGVVTWSFAGAGLSDFREYFVANTVAFGSVLSFDFEGLMRQAFAAWSVHGNIEFIEVPDTNIQFGSLTGGFPSIRIGMGPIDPALTAGGVIGIGDFATNSFTMAIHLHSGAAWTQQLFSTVLTHEIGHTLGLNHSNDPNALMAANGGLGSIQSDDVAGIQHIYGVQDNLPATYTMPSSQAALTITYGINGMTIVGNALSNTIVGTALNEVFRGLAANDTVTGGGGIDFASYGATRTSYAIAKTGAGFRITDLRGGSPEGTDTLVDVDNAVFTDLTVTLRQAKSNFNFATPSDAGATSDVLLQSGGIVVDWIMQNGAFVAGNVITSGAAGYTARGTGDFNADGTADIVLQSAGTVVRWTMGNGVYQSGGVITTGAAGFTIVGTGDFNNDGTADILLQNGGTVVDWLMQNGNYLSGSIITTGATGFTVAGTGDFNGDGTSDILLQNGGTVVAWFMQNGAYAGGSVLTTGALGFTIRGTGDFNGDGTTDIVLQSGGMVVDWIMQNGQVQSGNVITTGAGGFTVAATGDYNGDGTADIMLQSGGTVVAWLMSGGLYSSGATITTGATGFTVVG